MKKALNLVSYVSGEYVDYVCGDLYGKPYELLTDTEMRELEFILNQQILNDY